MQPRDRLVLVCGLATCAAIWGGGRGVPALARVYGDAKAEATESVRWADEARAAIQLHPTVADSLAVRQGRVRQLMPRVLVAKTPTLLASNASAYLSRLASASHLRVTSVQVTSPDTRAGQARTVRVAMTAAGDVRGVMRFLAAVESGRKLIRVASLSIAQPDVVGRDNTPETLNFQLTLDAFGLLAGAK